MFRHFGASDADVRWEVHRCVGIDPRHERDYLEDAVVYLGRYAHMAYPDVMALELDEVERYVRKTRKWVYAEHGLDENGEKVNSTTSTDKFT